METASEDNAMTTESEHQAQLGEVREVTMNERGHDLLVQAGLTGHQQIFGAFHTDIGDCALGVLHLVRHENRQATKKCLRSADWDLTGIEWGACTRQLCNLFSLSVFEMWEIICLNDVERLDFIGIARKLYTPTQEGA